MARTPNAACRRPANSVAVGSEPNDDWVRLPGVEIRSQAVSRPRRLVRSLDEHRSASAGDHQLNSIRARVAFPADGVPATMITRCTTDGECGTARQSGKGPARAWPACPANNPTRRCAPTGLQAPLSSKAFAAGRRVQW